MSLESVTCGGTFLTLWTLQCKVAEKCPDKCEPLGTYVTLNSRISDGQTLSSGTFTVQAGTSLCTFGGDLFGTPVTLNVIYDGLSGIVLPQHRYRACINSFPSPPPIPPVPPHPPPSPSPPYPSPPPPSPPSIEVEILDYNDDHCSELLKAFNATVQFTNREFCDSTVLTVLISEAISETQDFTVCLGLSARKRSRIASLMTAL